MPTLDVSGLKNEERHTAVWAAALLQGIARAEAAGRRPPRLTEPKLETWTRFRGRLTSVDLVSILFEDEAVLLPVPFSPRAVGGPSGPIQLDQLPRPTADAWLRALGELAPSPTAADFVREQARALSIPTQLARSDLHVVKSYQKVLELPGTGGQLAFHLATTQPELKLHDNFTIACGSWSEMTLAGLIAFELDAPHSRFITAASVDDLRNPEHPLRQQSFDFVVGLHPDKGGLLRVEDQLAIWYPTAKILLV